MRCLVVGGSGWVGTAVTNSLTARSVPHLATGSSQPLSSRRTYSDVQDFRADTLIFLGGVTPDRERILGLGQYESALASVSAELETALSLAHLERVCYLSSGIVQQHENDLRDAARRAYHQAKIREECLVHGLGARLESQIIRLYSLSGPHLRRPSNYAFHDLVSQGLKGSIDVRATRPTFRSYVSVTDLAEVIVESLAQRQTGLRVTGGEPIEMGDLAKRIAQLVSPGAEVRIPPRVDGSESYCGDEASWREWCDAVGVESRTLDQQILETAEWLRGMPT
jgi:nucleoside-diphosphate-sugar epimerase